MGRLHRSERPRPRPFRARAREDSERVLDHGSTYERLRHSRSECRPTDDEETLPSPALLAHRCRVFRDARPTGCDSRASHDARFHAEAAARAGSQHRAHDVVADMSTTSALALAPPILAYPPRARHRGEVFDYIEAVYNRVRRHSTLGVLAPLEFEDSTLMPHRPGLAASRLGVPQNQISTT